MKIAWAVFIFISIYLPAMATDDLDRYAISNMSNIAVFPVESTELSLGLKSSLWWTLRKELSSDLRFKVASKDFLEHKDVYSPKSLISPSQAILLAKHLEADTIMSLSFKDRELHLRVYSGGDGSIVDHLSRPIHSSYTSDSILIETLTDLVKKWIARLPTQANLVGIEKGILEFETGRNLKPTDFEKVKVVRVYRESLGPLLEGRYRLVSIEEEPSLIRREGTKLYIKAGKNILYGKDADFSYFGLLLPNRKLELSSKYLGKGSGPKAGNLIHQSGAPDNKTNDSKGLSRIMALVNLLIIVALSI